MSGIDVERRRRRRQPRRRTGRTLLGVLLPTRTTMTAAAVRSWVVQPSRVQESAPAWVAEWLGGPV